MLLQFTKMLSLNAMSSSTVQAVPATTALQDNDALMASSGFLPPHEVDEGVIKFWFFARLG